MQRPSNHPASAAPAPSTTEELLPIAYAAGHARDIVTDACLRWGLDDLVAPAALVVTELISNVVDHAHTFMTLDVVLRPTGLYLAVTDGSTAPPVPRPYRTPTERGLGLHLVAQHCAEWGWITEGDGKTVWARLTVENRIR